MTVERRSGEWNDVFGPSDTPRENGWTTLWECPQGGAVDFHTNISLYQKDDRLVIELFGPSQAIGLFEVESILEAADVIGRLRPFADLDPPSLHWRLKESGLVEEHGVYGERYSLRISNDA